MKWQTGLNLGRTFVIFIAILGAFAVMLSINFAQIRSISTEISSYLVNSAHLEEASRADMEGDNVIQKAFLFSNGDKNVSREDLNLALDVFWSRIEALDSPNYRGTLSGSVFEGGSLLPEIHAALPVLEEAVEHLQFGDLKSYQPMADFAMKYMVRLSDLGDAAYAERRKRMNASVESSRENLKQLEWFQFEIVGFGLVIFFYMVLQLLQSRRLNSRLTQTLDEKRTLLTTDHLTGIHNRLFFEDAFLALPAGKPFNVILFDLDGFKDVNDSHGHGVGDRLLVRVAQILASLAQPGDVVARFGGDEFAVLSLGDCDKAAAYAGEALGAIGAPFAVQGLTLKVSGSAGILHCDGAGETLALTNCLRDADLALYAAKANGKNRYEVLDLALLARQSDRRQLQQDLPQDIQRGHLGVEFQPIVHLADKKTVGFEALLRWTHPSIGVVSPLTVVSISEEIGLVRDLTLYVAEMACIFRSEAKARGHRISVSINVPPSLLKLADFGNDIVSILERFSLSGRGTVLELTEEGTLVKNDVVTANMQRLRACGIRLSIDDFGKGYSNLSRLAQMEIDLVKLDKSLIDHIHTSQRSLNVVAGIVQTLRSLNIDIVAEGVELAIQRDILTNMGVQFAQGFLFAKSEMTKTALEGLEKQRAGAGHLAAG